MEIQVYLARWETAVPAVRAALEAQLPPERLERLGRAGGEKRLQAAAAYGLLRYGLRRLTGTPELPALSYGPHGKPAFLQAPALQFSLSHTTGLAACALSDAPVGVDVERIRPVPAARARRLGLPAQPEDFFALWVERESRLKCRGGGALAGRRAVPARPGEVYRPLEAGKGYAAGLCAVCADPVRLVRLSLEELAEEA